MIELDVSNFSDSLLKKVDALMPAAAMQLKALKDRTCVGSEWTGWYNYPEHAGFQLVDQVRSYVAGLKVDYDLVVVIGIGGSYLGARAVTDALSHDYASIVGGAGGGRPLVAYAGQHLSETSLAELMQLIEHRQPLVNVISKSGTTTEPAVAFRLIREHLAKRYDNVELSRRIVATTDPEKGALRRLAEQNDLKTFAVPPDVGGRFSVLSAVGLVPLALGGFDVEALMAGAADVFQSLASPSAEHPVLRYAACRYAAYESGKVAELLAISEPKLRNLTEWWKQLFGESEGKDGQGLLPISLTYTTDLHSLGQIVQDGPRNMFETFLTFKEDRTRLQVPEVQQNLDELNYLAGKSVHEINQAAVKATKMAHTDGGVPCLELRAGSISERTLGQLFAFFETACAISAAMLKVNPFDQPGVEAYKKNMFDLLGRPG